MNLFKKIRRGLGKTREALVGNLQAAIGGRGIDDQALERIEEILITSDLGVEVTFELINVLRERARHEEIAGDRVLEVIEEQLSALAGEAAAPDTQPPSVPPLVSFVIGVNGSGKTTTIGKLARRYADSGERVLIVAADTFRGAAVEQVAIWAERAGVDIVRGSPGADPASVVYDGLQAAVSRGADRVYVDTAGRLHTKVNLMNELEKMTRVARKLVEDAPHEVLLVIDGTTGQNGLSQARAFAETSGVTGIVVTKLDGTAKGGIIVPIARDLGIPVRWIGVGEGGEDLLPFDPAMFVSAVFGSGDGDG